MIATCIQQTVTNYMCENAQHWSQAYYWKKKEVSHKYRTERDDYGLHINKSNGLHRRYSVSNTTTKDIKYTVCMKRTIVSNLTITLCEPLESLTKRDHSITEYYSSSSILDQNHPFFLKAVQIQSSNLFIIKNLIIMKWHTVLINFCLSYFQH